MSDIQPLDARAVVEQYFENVSAGRFAEAAALMAPDATLWIVGDGNWPLGGLHDVESNKRIYEIVKHRFPDGLRITLKALTVEGDRVAAEVESYGVRRDGEIYNNHYHYVIIVEEGLIRHRREYLDTLHADELLCGILKEAG